MKRLLLPLTVLATTALLWTSATPAHACECIAGLTPEHWAQGVLKYADLVVLGQIADTGSDHLQFDVAVAYKGNPPERITLDQRTEIPNSDYERRFDSTGPDCSFGMSGLPGTRYLLALTALEPLGTIYRAGGCSSFRVQESGESEYQRAVARLANGGVPVGAADFPYLPVAVAATLGPLAFLVGAAFLWPRRRA